MSRLLNSLNDAQRERQQDAVATADAGSAETSEEDQEPGYFWTSILLLILVCGLIVGGYMALTGRVPGLMS
jgi:hypothetical protein